MEIRVAQTISFAIPEVLRTPSEPELDFSPQLTKGISSYVEVYEPVREQIESAESFVIQGGGLIRLGGRRCGRARIADAMTEADCAIRAM